MSPSRNASSAVADTGGNGISQGLMSATLDGAVCGPSARVMTLTLVAEFEPSVRCNRDPSVNSSHWVPVFDPMFCRISVSYTHLTLPTKA